MRSLRTAALIACMSFAAAACGAQDLPQVKTLWSQTVEALHRGDSARANAAFARFNAAARAYVRAHGRNWQIEYLAGSLDCMFPDTRTVGSEFLSDILQNNRTLNGDGYTELRRQLQACTAAAQPTSSTLQTSVPPDLTEVSTHFQAPGIRGDMKGGGFRVDQESSRPVTSLPPGELASRLVPATHPDLALQGALARLPRGASGAVFHGFAVATLTGTSGQAGGIARCLESYASPLRQEFGINSSAYTVTAYAVASPNDVYESARRLHGLQLPQGVIAYSVPEDMSLTSMADEASCGSMAHELVHLLIKQSFPGAPAWLEEGLASEVAIAVPAPDRLRFGWSWRDETLRTTESLRPSVAELLQLPWSGLNPDAFSGMRRCQAIQAMAAVFIRYLDEKGVLSRVYFAARDQHLGTDLNTFKSYQSILEESLGRPIAAIDQDFEQWFRAQRQVRMSPPDPGPYEGGNALPRPMNTASPFVAPCTPHRPGEQQAQQVQQTAPCTPTGPNAPPNAPAIPSPPSPKKQ